MENTGLDHLDQQGVRSYSGLVTVQSAFMVWGRPSGCQLLSFGDSLLLDLYLYLRPCALFWAAFSVSNSEDSWRNRVGGV